MSAAADTMARTLATQLTVDHSETAIGLGVLFAALPTNRRAAPRSGDHSTTQGAGASIEYQQ